MSKSNTKTDPDQGIYTDLPGLVGLRFASKDLKLFARQPARSLLLGETKSSFRGRGMEFEEVRHYQPGDDIRTIDWRVSARTGKVHTKLFREERERPVHLMVDQRSSMFFGSRARFKSVLAAEVTACLAWAALSGSDRIGALLFGDSDQRDVRARRSRHTVLRILHDLNALNHQLPGRTAETIELSAMVEECRRVARPGTAVFLISDFHDFDESTEKAMTLLGRHTDLTLVKIFDPLETQLPIRGNVELSNGREKSRFSVDAKLAERFVAATAERNARLARAVRVSRARFLEISTGDNPVQMLLRSFRG